MRPCSSYCRGSLSFMICVKKGRRTVSETVRLPFFERARAAASDGLGEPDLLAEQAGLVRTLPGERRHLATEVPVPCRLAVDRPTQVQRLDDVARRQLEVLADQT